VATVDNTHDFKHGRPMAAWLGLVPTQHSSGGRARQIWAMLARDVDYDPHACLKHPMHQQTRAVHAA
jgi:hypothetical protein